MKKSVAVFLVVMFVVAFLSPLIIPLVNPPEPVDWEPLNVRYTEASTKIQKYTQPIWTGKAMFMIPMTRTVNHPEKWEVQWRITYDDGSRAVVWEECSEESFNVFKGFLEGGDSDG